MLNAARLGTEFWVDALLHALWLYCYIIDNIIQLQSKRLLMMHLRVNIQLLNQFLRGDGKLLQRKLVQDQQLLLHMLMTEYCLVI